MLFRSGVEWEQEWVDKIRGKIEFLWEKPQNIENKFNAETGEFGNYVYDPNGDTTRVPYEKCVSKEKCDHIFSDREQKFQFSPEKVLRLVFHDCIPYKGENGAVFGGCDGCINLDENLQGLFLDI